MTKAPKVIVGGFFLTTFVLVWIVYSYATAGVIISGTPASWLLALATSAVLTLVFVFGRQRSGQ